MFSFLLNPFVWFRGSPPAGWERGLEVYWPIVVEGALATVALGLIGCFLVVRGLSLLGDALAHSVLPGIVVGFLIGGSLHSPWILIGATIVGMGAAVLVQAVQEHSRVKEDASLGIIFTSLFALGVVMINLYARNTDLDPGCVLYGNIEHFIIRRDAIWVMAGVLGLVLVLLVAFYRHVLISTFDPGLAVSQGIPASFVHYGLMGVLSLTVVASFEAVGAPLAVALLILPGSTARLWTDRMPAMLTLAAVHGLASTLLGYWLAHPAVMNTSASGAICVAGFLLFLASWILAPRHGLLPRWLTRRKLSATIAVENLLKAVEDLSLRGGGGAAVVLEAELAGELRLPPRRLKVALERAAARRWVTRDPGGRVTLTDAGREQSTRLVRAHELWEQYLRQEVGLEADHVHDAAEWVEHYLSDDKLEYLNEMLAGADKGPSAALGGTGKG
jgi:manganese/zinc/iron transport system permease protein